MSASRFGEGVAIVGMAGRFPGARSVGELWDNLIAGRECITRFAPGQLDPSIPAKLREHPRYVPARGVMDDADRFDASFFGISPAEALLMDPQQRVLLELCWNALEHAGVDPSRFAGSVGVYAGTSNNTYRKRVEARPDLLRTTGEFTAMLANEKDYAATRVAHRLDLHGPALSIHTACSTSLVAVAQAWYALMSWQCDLALAGGINIVVPQESGYLPVEGGMESTDGHCRPFDAQAGGTVFSSGGAVVALKRLSDAIESGDTIWAVIRGVAVNNDGGDKASFSAPSVRGQATAIRQALACADVGADSIQYVEAHGTGTQLGDPIEVEALTRAYREDTQAKQYCWIGSAKGNLGHLIAAAGVTGLIKATLSLHHGRIPPSLHFERANPEIDFESSPFKVADREIEWPRNGTPRRAAVSSFGVGGTNAHVILEEAPEVERRGPQRETGSAAGGAIRSEVLVLSAHDEAALQRRAGELAQALRGCRDGELPDIAATLALGRKPMRVRCAVVARGIEQACERLPQVAMQRMEGRPKVVFLFPGQGSQHAGMARELVDSEPVFREAFERCCALASRLLDRDLRELILPPADRMQEAQLALAETRYTQPALFAVEYALAELWESWGVRADAMIGHSSGEYVAACRAGVFTLEQAIELMIARAAAMHAQPRGAMLALRVAERDLPKQLPRNIEVAAVNAPMLTVLAGAEEAIENCAARLAEADIASTRLQVSHAFHSSLMEGALPAFRDAFGRVQARPPQRTFYSCVSGLPIEGAQAISADYWCSQLRKPVRFADALQHVLARAEGPTLLLEVGPGQALTGLARRMLEGRGRAIASLGPVARPGDAAEHLRRALGDCWSTGVEPDWRAVFAGRIARRVPLPVYPFRGERYWIDAPAEAANEAVIETLPRVDEGVQAVQAAVDALVPGPIAQAIEAEPRGARLVRELRELFGKMAGVPIGDGQLGWRLLDLGMDSLALTQAALEVERRFGVPVKFRRLLEDLDSIEKLATMLERALPEEASPAPPEAAAEIAGLPAGQEPLLLQLLHNQQVLMERQAELQRALSAAQESEPPQPVELALTDSQMEKWLAGQFGGVSDLCYNESFLLNLEGPLDRNAMEDALRYVIGRHEAFTLSFAADGSVQRTGTPQPPPMQFMDISGEGVEQRLAEHCRRELQHAFDLQRAPLIRTQLLRLAPQRHALLIVVHHLVLDGWSEVVLLDELAQAYNAFAAGEKPAWAPAESWCGYVRAEADRRGSERGERQIEFWRNRYATLPEPLALPTDRPRSQAIEMDFAAATARHDFAPELVAALRARAREQGITFYSLLLAGLGVLLSRLSGQHDLTVGIPFAGQVLAGRHDLIGDCVNTLPLRMRVEDEQTFEHLAFAVHRELLDAGENQDATLYTVLHALDQPAGERPRLAEVVFSLNPRMSTRVFDKLRHSVRDCERAALFPELFFNLYEGDGGLSLDLHYRTAYFDGATIRRWISHYEVLLAGALEHGEATVAALPLLTAGERLQILHGWNDSAREYDRNASLVSLIGAQAMRTPEHIAVEHEDGTLSYAQLERRSDTIAHALLARGVHRGELVGVCVQRGTELLPALLGIMKSGAAYVPLDPAFPPERLRYMADHSGLRHVVVLRAESTPEVVKRGRALLELSRLPRRRRLLRKPLPVLSGDDLAYVLYTSGSTGQPKGVRILHRNLVNFLSAMAERPGIGADDVLCAITTLSFDIAGLELYLPLAVGARVALAGERLVSDPAGMMQLIRERGVTILQTTPSLLRLLLDGGRIEGVRGLKLLVGGEALPRDLAEAVLPRCRELWNLYGPTETTIWSTASRVEHGSGPLPLGTPIANTQIYVLDARGQPVPPGVAGEIWIGGAGVADGYQGRPELTAERFVPNPFVADRHAAEHARMYRTGDMGTLRDGVLYFFGRADDQIKLRGYRIEPGDIEAAALAVPGVREAVAVARDFSATDKRLVLYVAGNPDVAKLRARLRTGLPLYMLPQHIEVLGFLPKTPNGKIDRKALPMPSSIGGSTAEAEGQPEQPLGHLERIFLQLWRDLLRVHDIGLDDNFFDLGGDSLLAVRVFQRAQELTGVNLPLSTLLTSPTIAGQVAAFRAAGAAEPDGGVSREAETASENPWALLVPLQPRGTLPPLFCVHAVGGNVLGYKPLAQALGEDRPFYGIQAVGLDGITPPLQSLPAMASRYCAEIRAVQPHGPYFLAGRSMGGMIAYEIARQLHEQGEHIALLALFDTYGPGNYHFELQRAGSLRRMGHAWRGRWRRMRQADLRKFREWIVGFAYWRSLWLTDALRLRWARATGRTLPHALRYRVLLRSNERAYYSYVPPPYPGRITLFRAAEHPPEMAASDGLGWESTAVDLEVIQMTGDHDSLIEQPSLAPVLRATLARAQAAVDEQGMAAPTDPRQVYLAGVWRDVIGVRQVHAGDNFFELGGHSLLAVEMAARVQRETGAHLNLFKIATESLATLAAELPEPADQPEPATSAWRRMRIALGLAHAG